MPELLCASCSMALPEGFRFCPSCGTAVQEETTDARKTVSLLFCDVSGSTAMGEHLDPEVLRSVMGDYFLVARAAVERHGGTVEKFVGDAVLAVFGIPVVREDDALRAVRAAAELRDALVVLAGDVVERHDVRLAVRIAVNTGEVVAGGSRAGGSFATGDAVNTAARLEQAAAPDEILLGTSTYRLVRDAVVAEAVDPIAAKGKAEPLEAFRLVEVLDVDAGRSRRTDTPLIGRERERRVLDEALDRVVADARCQMVTLLGPAGMGKTRLLADFEASLDPTVRVLRGRCLSYGRGITFWPIVSVLRAAAGLTGTEPPEPARATLRGMLTGLAEADAVTDRLAPLMGLGGEPAGTEETYWAVCLLLEQLAETAPVVLVVDDLHWAEPALLDLLEHVRDETRDVPLLMVCPARPELLEQRPGWGGGAVNATTLLLEPLSSSHTHELLDGLLGTGVPPAVTDAVNRWGDGNPLFLEEVSTHLVEEGVLVRTEQGWGLTADLDAVRVPPTVTALLSARLDRLPTAERALLEQISVIGLEVTRSEADALSSSAEVPALLGALTRKGLLRRVRGGRGEAFVFRHVLVREAAYDGLPKGQRADMHERYADRLGTHGGDAGGEVDAFVGHHLEQATKLRRELSPGSSDVDGLAARAAEALAIAAGRARHADDLQAAEQLYGRSLGLTPSTDPARRRRLLQLAWTHAARWQTAPAKAAVDEGLSLRPPGPPDALHLALEAEWTELELAAGAPVDPALLRERSAAAAAAARAAGDAEALSHTLSLQLGAAIMLARWDVVAASARELVRTGLPAERTGARHALLGAAVGGSQPFPDVLTMLTEEDADIGRSAGMRAHLVGTLSIALAGQGRLAEARTELGKARALLEDGQLEVGPYAFMASDVLLAAGDVDGAVRELRVGVQYFRESGGLAYASTLLGQLALLLLQRGDQDGAEQAIDEADALTSPYDVISVALVLTVRALLAARRGDAAVARDLSLEALGEIDKGDAPTIRGDLYRALAEVPARSGDIGEQRRMLGEALRVYRAKGHLPFAERTQRMLDDLG